MESRDSEADQEHATRHGTAGRAGVSQPLGTFAAPTGSGKSDPLRPSAALLSAIGSALVHADEYLSEEGHPVDLEAFRSAMRNTGVRDWLAEMTAMAMLPVRRQKGETMQSMVKAAVANRKAEAAAWTKKKNPKKSR